jgi:SAM-dependent methyltransferase
MTRVGRIASTKTTDWSSYYQKSPAPSLFTRRIIQRTFIAAFKQYSVSNPMIAELGGAGSRVFDSVERNIAPSVYHVIDNNQYGLNLLRRRVGDRVVIHNQDVLNLKLEIEVDTVFSLGLIEHFDESGTQKAILAHFSILKPGGIAIISFPTPTVLYRTTRRAAELVGQWIFHDERPLWTAEVLAAIGSAGELLSSTLIWPIFLTQTLVVIRKR